MTNLVRGHFLNEEEFQQAYQQHGDEFTAKMGAEAIHEMLKTMDLQSEVIRLRE